MRRVLLALAIMASVALPSAALTATPAGASHGCYAWAFDNTYWNWYSPGADNLQYCVSPPTRVSVVDYWSYHPNSYQVHLPYNCTFFERYWVANDNSWRSLRDWQQGPVGVDVGVASDPPSGSHVQHVLYNYC